MHPDENTGITLGDFIAPFADQIPIIHTDEIRQQPLTDIKAYNESLREFPARAYSTSLPYDELVEAAQYSAAQYEQFAAALRKDALSKGADMEVVDSNIRMYRQIFFTHTREANTILEAIHREVADETDKVKVYSFPCGSGKSTALTMLIRETIERADGNGLIIVTDSVDRMKAYWDADSTNPSFYDDFLRYVAAHKDDVTVLTGTDLQQGRKDQWDAPVLIMTTQRYFKCRRREIEEFLRWKEGVRPLIIFDEAPYLQQTRNVTPETFDKVSSRLRMGLEATTEEEIAAKKTAIDTWERLRTTYLSKLDELEYTPDCDLLYCAGQPDEAIDHLIAYVTEHASRLNNQKEHITGLVRDVCQLAAGWGLYAHLDSATAGKYESKFVVHHDNRELVTDLAAKVIILDGTADLLPIYQEDYIELGGVRQFERSMGYLTIVLCDLDTKSSLLNHKDSTLPATVRSFLAADTKRDPSLVIFTSKAAEGKFSRLGFDSNHLGHFNNIKGLNTYSQAVNIAQVGLNRNQQAHYFAMDLGRNVDLRERLAASNDFAGALAATKEVSRELKYNEGTATRYILADIEQNMFRSAIRKVGNDQDVNYYLFFNHETNQALIATMKDRYERLRVKFRVVSRDEIEKHKPVSMIEERIAKIQKWYDGWDGQPVKRSDILIQLKMDRKAFDKALEHPSAIAIHDLLKAAAQKARDAGYKRGWYMK